MEITLEPPVDLFSAVAVVARSARSAASSLSYDDDTVPSFDPVGSALLSPSQFFPRQFPSVQMQNSSPGSKSKADPFRILNEAAEVPGAAGAAAAETAVSWSLATTGRTPSAAAAAAALAEVEGTPSSHEAAAAPLARNSKRRRAAN
eukprot:CAMPEP_0171623304 /NCGR_PEP_ID=MMETSP0990-20121206/17855_1 /TAXON_ID=483369 /ORGANISM="non described non described, Strain CCMP2098" /LENGTH=146 /DNA_ID=CAMNT_0012189459 /DNA_START=815 /DNA_END=1257 /DNA_ORIENTATION=+